MVVPLVFDPALPDLMRRLRPGTCLQRAEGVEDPCGFGLFGPGQQLRDEHPAAGVAQEGLHAQAFRQRSKLDIAPVAVRAHGDALQQQGGQQHRPAHEDHPDRLRLVVQQKVLAEELIKRGFSIVSGGTDNHSMLVDLRSKYPDLTGKVAENALVAADITVNKNMVPFDSRSAFQTSGIRLGTPAATSRGLKEDDFDKVAEAISLVVKGGADKVEEARAIVKTLTDKYPLNA